MIKFLKNNIYYILLVLIVILGFILRLKGFIDNPSLWHDESALGWNILNKSYGQLFEKLRFLQIAPPLFLVFTKFLVFITNSYNNVLRCDMVLRLLSFIFGNLSIITFYFVCKKLFQSKWSALAGVTFIALNPTLINYSFEFKPYSLDLFTSMLALLIFLNINFKTVTLKKICIYGLILSILPWFSFGSVFVILSGILVLSFKKENPKLFFSLLALPVLSAISYLNIYVIKIYSQNSNGMLGFWHDYFVKSDFSNIYPLINDNLHYFFSSVQHFPFWIASITIIAGFILFIKKSEFFFVQITILIFSTLIFASMLKFYPFSRRMILFLIPIIVIYMVKITDTKKWYIASLILSLLIIPHFIFAFKFLNLQNVNKGYFAREMMFIMAKEINTNDKIILSEGSNADYFYYNSFFKIPNKVEYIKPNKTENETNSTLLNKLPKGKYWIFASYDYNTKFINNQEIKFWAKSKCKVDFEASSTQSTLMRVILH